MRDKALNITKNPKYDGYQRGLVLMVYKFFDEKSASDAVTRTNKAAIKSKIIPCQELAEDIRQVN